MDHTHEVGGSSPSAPSFLKSEADTFSVYLSVVGSAAKTCETCVRVRRTYPELHECPAIPSPPIAVIPKMTAPSSMSMTPPVDVPQRSLPGPFGSPESQSAYQE